MKDLQSVTAVNPERITVPYSLKHCFIKSLCLFEGISLTDIQAERILNKDNSQMLAFSEDDALIIRNAADSFDFLDSADIAGLNVDLCFYIKLNAIFLPVKAFSVRLTDSTAFHRKTTKLSFQHVSVILPECSHSGMAIREVRSSYAISY